MGKDTIKEFVNAEWLARYKGINCKSEQINLACI